MTTRDPDPLAWVLTALAGCVLVNAIAIGYLVSDGERWSRAVSVTAAGQAMRLLQPGGDDSWKPMARADAYSKANPNQDIYGVFFEDKVKFQYPPSALFLWRVLPASLYTGPGSVRAATPLRAWLAVSTLAAALLTVAASIWIFRLGLLGLPGHWGERRLRRAHLVTLIGVGFLLGLTYYPLNKAHSGGQIQIFLGLLIAASLLAHVKGRAGTAGACLGLCCLVKPQYAIVLASAILLRHWRFALPMAGVGALGIVGAVVVFGFDNHLRYLDVLRDLSNHGETYWPNQSVNGLMNRLLGNGVAETFNMAGFPPYHRVVYFATLVSSVAMVVVSLWAYSRRDGCRSHDTLWLAIAVMAATMASPIAWEHHYGAFLPVFAMATPLLLREQPVGRWTGLLLLASYLAMANVIRTPERIFWNPWRGLAGSHLFFGALILLALCIATRRNQATAGPPARGFDGALSR
jgi:alpha-1,2-mannosyltransferase